MILEKVKSAIYNNVMSGLKGVSINSPFTLEQIEDDIIVERLAIIKEYAVKNLIPLKDLMYPIRCVEVDCESLERCACDSKARTKLKHFQIPQIFNDFGVDSIGFAGSSDGLIEYKVYVDESYRQHKHRRRGIDKPYIWIDTTPNENNMYDAFIFNASPMLKELSIRLIPKDVRQLAWYSCCDLDETENMTFITKDIIKRLTENYIRYYRQMAMAHLPNDQNVKS